MHLALLTNNRFPPREGIGRHTFEVARRLQARGHRVTVLARGRAFGRWAESHIDGLQVRHYPHVPLQPFHHALARTELAGWLLDGADGADLLHVHLPLLPPLTTRLPVVATFHSPMLADTAAISERGWRPALIRANAWLFSRRYEQWYLDHAAQTVVVSDAVRLELEAGYRVPHRPAVVPNGVDLGIFDGSRAAPGDRATLFREWLCAEPRGWSPAHPPAQRPPPRRRGPPSPGATRRRAPPSP